MTDTRYDLTAADYNRFMALRVTDAAVVAAWRVGYGMARLQTLRAHRAPAPSRWQRFVRWLGR